MLMPFSGVELITDREIDIIEVAAVKMPFIDRWTDKKLLVGPPRP